MSISCAEGQGRGNDGKCGPCGEHSTIEQGVCVCEAGYLRSLDTCLPIEPPPPALAFGEGWSSDPDDDGVAVPADNCPGIYNPAPQSDADGDGIGDACDPDFAPMRLGGPVSDLAIEHVTPYGAWFTFRSPRTAEYGYDAALVWSTNRADVETAANMGTALGRGNGVKIPKIRAEFGDPVGVPIVVTKLEPATTYYAALGVLETDTKFADAGNVVTFKTTAAPFGTLSKDHPRIAANAEFLAALKSRASSGDTAFTQWKEKLSRSISRALTGEAFAPESFCRPAAYLYAATGDTQYLTSAKQLLNVNLNLWKGEVCGNCYRWWNTELSACLDLLWDEIGSSQRSTMIDAILKVAEAETMHNAKGELRASDTDEYVSYTRNAIADGGLICGAMGVSSDQSQRGCALFEWGLRNWYGGALPQLRREGRYLAQSGGFMADGSSYGIATSKYWLDTFFFLQNAGTTTLKDYGAWVRNNFWSMYAYALTPSMRGVSTHDDIENGGAEGELGSFSLGGFDQMPQYEGLLAMAGRLEDAGQARWLLGTAYANVMANGSWTHVVFDTAAILARDYRKSLPTAYLDTGRGLVRDRTSWSTGASAIDAQIGWRGVDHNHGDAGSVQLYRAGRWITHEAWGYDGVGATWQGHNVLGLRAGQGDNVITQYRGSDAGGAIQLGASASRQHTYAAADLTAYYTDLYDHHRYYDAVQRSILWIKGDEGQGADTLVVYDLVEPRSGAPATLEARAQWNFDFAPKISGRTATVAIEGTPAQRVELFFSSSNDVTLSTIAATGPVGGYPGTVWTHRVVAASDAGQGLRLVTVLNAVPATATVATPPIAATGPAVEGILFGRTLALFPHAVARLRTPVTSAEAKVVTAAAVQVYWAGFNPSSGYGVTAQQTGDTLTLTVGAGSLIRADRGGVLRFSVDAGRVVKAAE